MWGFSHSTSLLAFPVVCAQYFCHSNKCVVTYHYGLKYICIMTNDDMSFYSLFVQRRWWHPTPVLLPGKSHGQRSLSRLYVVHGVANSRTRLSHFPFTFHFHALEKEMATHSNVLAWRTPGTGGVLSMGSHRVGYDWSNLAAAALEHKLSRVLVFKARTSSSEPTLLVTLSDTILYSTQYINQWERCFWHKVFHIWHCHMNSEKPTYTFIYE